MNFLILLIYPDIFLHTKDKKVLIIWYNHISEVLNMTNKYKNNNFSVDDLIKGLGDTINSKINESNFADLNDTVKRSIDIALDQVNN